MLGDAAGASAAFQGEPDAPWRRQCLPLGYHAVGDAARADAALADLVAHPQGSEFQVAEVYSFLGDAGKAFEWLDKALGNDPGVVWSRDDPLLASIEGDPRFATYLKRLGMPPERND